MKEDKSELDSKAELLSQSIREMSEYNQLAEAFGKKGLQAIIIENAIPEIEAEANRILARLTDNRMHMALLTQQRTRQGNPIETLEIIIADELGTRSYELYSGGEAFRVNFALRVAMSRLLARRAGARLETLIIDEGFGSQDEQSRTKMIQAIASIKPDFARIIVVTHIAEVKEMFPVQISVEKEEGLSKVSIQSWS
jgi:exonuclease SbcC